ncbi:MAG: hypothetical protein ACXABD_18780 [Candidatus Thorarchaeota archaeon]|jgi:hypothetical protein
MKKFEVEILLSSGHTVGDDICVTEGCGIGVSDLLVDIRSRLNSDDGFIIIGDNAVFDKEKIMFVKILEKVENQNNVLLFTKGGSDGG